MQKITTFTLLAWCLFSFAAPLSAQNSRQAKEPSFEEIQRQIDRIERQLSQDLEKNSFFRGDWLKADSTGTSFFFRVDTAFNSMPGMDFFQWFGDELDRAFLGQGGENPFPSDDGAIREGKDEPLPEERLRQQRQSPQERSAPAKPEEKSKKNNLKTIRI